jgi:eukaryotic-like serine/threonine-protein kinase
MIGQTLGHHRILEKIGAGGMGEVYRAEDVVLGRQVAIKVLRPEIMSDSASRARFLREARTIAALSHPNIAVLYEAGESDGLPFLVMEFIQGTTLCAEVAAGPLSEA